jgi:hypothetical protein
MRQQNGAVDGATLSSPHLEIVELLHADDELASLCVVALSKSIEKRFLWLDFGSRRPMLIEALKLTMSLYCRLG